MVLDSKFQLLKDHFGVSRPEDWQSVRPEWVLGIDGVGPVTLDHLRIYLAARGLTLANDQTPEYWQANLAAAKVGQTLGWDDTAKVTPFTVLIDAQEKQPFTFKGMLADGTDAPLIVQTEWKSLGESWGDYSLAGYEGRCHVERKSADDAAGTILGWGDRRERFERELERLAGIDCAAVVVECTLATLLGQVPARGKKSIDENRKILFRQVLAWLQDYRVPWLFCDSRRMAEVATFRILDRYWRKQQKSKPKAVCVDEVIAAL